MIFGSAAGPASGRRPRPWQRAPRAHERISLALAAGPPRIIFWIGGEARERGESHRCRWWEGCAVTCSATFAKKGELS